MRMDNDENVTMMMHCHAVSAKAMLLSEHGEEDQAVWIPKSQIVSAGTDKRGTDGEFTIKQWILEKNGLF